MYKIGRGGVKSTGFANKVNSTEEMKRPIREAFDYINFPMLRRKWADLEQRLGYIRANNAKHVEIRSQESTIINLRKLFLN